MNSHKSLTQQIELLAKSSAENFKRGNVFCVKYFDPSYNNDLKIYTEKLTTMNEK